MSVNTKTSLKSFSISEVLDRSNLKLTPSGSLHVEHDGFDKLTLGYINKYVPALKRMVICDYTRHPDGWQIEKDMPERAFFVKNGGLVDSCLFSNETQACLFVHRVNRGENPLTAMVAAMQS